MKKRYPCETDSNLPYKRVARSCSSHGNHNNKRYLNSSNEQSLNNNNNNNNSDDDIQGHFNWFRGQTLYKRYVVEKELGIGTFGKVIECRDLKHKDFVAIKVIRKVNKYIESAEIETEILDDIFLEQERQRRNYCVKLYSTFSLHGHYFMVFEPLGLSLFDIIKRNDYIGLPLSLVKSISKQILCALDFLQSMRLIHTDLKLENILFMTSQSRNCSIYCPRKRQHLNILVPISSTIKLIDFGGATYDYANKTSIINTRQYRGPEVILEANWSYPSDVWSTGCIIAEILDGELLYATHDDLDHLALMEKVLGQRIPSELVKLTPKFLRRELFSENDNLRSELLPQESIDHIRSQPTLEEKFSYYDNCNNGFGLIQLLYGLLNINPRSRLTPKRALDLPFFSTN